jgi:putative ABC transport system permease protein
VVTQFAISIVLIVATGMVYAQMRYARSLPLGYEKDQMVLVPGFDRVDDETYETLRNRLLQHTHIEAVSRSSLVPTDNLFAGTGFRLPGQSEDDEPLFYRLNSVDHAFFDTFGIEIVAGRGFSRDYGTDQISQPSEEDSTRTGALIMNASAAAKAGWQPEEAVGKTLFLADITFTVVGVTKDIYFSSIHHAIEPLVYFVRPGGGGDNLAIHVAATDLSATLAFIDQTWAEVIPAYPITRTFLDERFDAMYRQEERTATVITYFALFAVFIACLGLLGLAAFMAEQRIKEIGVRKVLGAAIPGIVLLLTKEFARLVLIAFVVAAPVAYVAVDRWLQAFAYRVEISWPIFLLAGLVALLVAVLTVSYQSIKAALADPVKSLRYE